MAIESLQALKKISQEHPTACLRAGALMAVLSYLDFFSTGVQRVALSTAANMCKKLPLDAADCFFKGSENTKLLLKPPRIVHKPTSLPTVPSNRDVSGSIQMKTNGRRTSAGNGANQQAVVAFSKTTGDSRGMSSRSILLPKPTPSHLNTMVFSSSSSPISSSSHSVKSPLENSRKRSALRNSDQSLSGTTTRTPIRTSKSKLGPSNFKFSSKASPSSSIDSFVSRDLHQPPLTSSLATRLRAYPVQLLHPHP